MSAVSLLISTYNWPNALNLCLKSILEQTVMPIEIVICDDGSTQQTKTLIDSYKPLFKIPIKHIWQEDDGFKLAQIRNKGFAVAKGDYLIQIDGDLILHKNFIKDHLRLKKKGYFTSGSRVLLSAETTRNLFNANTILVKKYSEKNKNFINSLRNVFLQKILSSNYKIKGKYKYYVKGCNMAFFKSDIIAVNGYNESFTGWGREDSEIAIRLINSGIKKQFLKFGGISYHLYHKEACRAMEQKNIDMMNLSIKNKTTLAPIGINQYL